MKVQTKRELLVLILGGICPLLPGIMLYIVWLCQVPLIPSFVSLANYLRMFQQDAAFLTGVRNSAFLLTVPLLAAVLAGKLLSMLLVKKGKLVGIVSLVFMLVLLGVIFFTLVIPTWQGDPFSALVRLRIVPVGEELAAANIPKSICFIMGAMFLAALSCCYSVFYLAGRFCISGFYRILLNLSGILAAQFWLASLSGTITALVGFPASTYATHTILNHIADYSAMPALSLLSIAGWLFNLSFAFLLTLLLWAFERWRLRKA